MSNTLTAVSGSYDPSTCEFTLYVTGESSGQPAYTLTPAGGGSPSMYSEGYGPYLQGAPIKIPAVSGATLMNPYMNSAVSENQILTITSE
jgi:hypothetical protein